MIVNLRLILQYNKFAVRVTYIFTSTMFKLPTLQSIENVIF